jgi:hypothetical protein
MLAAALIKLNPKEILKIYSNKPYNINIPDTWQVQNADVGFKTPDNLYEIVKVIPFVPPQGKQVNGIASYSFNKDGEVIETFEVVDIPLPPPPAPPPPRFIVAADFISRFTDEEYSNINKAALAQMQAGVATLKKWIDVATTDGYIDLDRPATIEAKNALIAANLLTKERADIIFSIQE